MRLYLNKFNGKGQSVIEVILAAALFMILATGAVAVILQGLDSNRLGEEQVVASQYASEGIEASRSIKNQGFANLSDSTGTGIIQSGGVWTFSGSNNVLSSKYTRVLTVSDVQRDISGNIVAGGGTPDPLTKKITSTVSWNFTPTRSDSVILTTYLSNWIAAITGNSGNQIVYYDTTNKALKYAVCTSSCTVPANWTTVTVDTATNTGEYASLAIYNGLPRISYYDSTNKELRYATCDSNCTVPASWTKITVDSSSPDVGWYTSLALDTAGNPRISYFDNGTHFLKYAFCNTACTVAVSWTNLTIDNSANPVGQYTSLALDSSNNPQISYYDAKNKHLKYIACSANCNLLASWTAVVVDSTTSTDVGRYTSLQINANGNRAISYYDFQNKNLAYALCTTNCTTAANWSHIIVDSSSSDIGQYSSLQFDGVMPRIAYYNLQNKVLRYASCSTSCLTASNWTLITADSLSGGNTGEFSSFIFTGGIGYISYYDVTNKDLRWTTCSSSCTTPSNWIKTLIDSTGDVGQYSSM